MKSLKNIYKFEQCSTAKIAHKLTSKVIQPTVLERQNVPLALAVGDQLTVMEDVYIHSAGKDIRLRDPDSKVFQLEGACFVSFTKFVSWCQDWKSYSVLVELENLDYKHLPEFENFDFRKFECHSCQTPSHFYPSKIQSTTSNCSLKNIVRNLNSKRNGICHREFKRKLTKFQSE